MSEVWDLCLYIYNIDLGIGLYMYIMYVIYIYILYIYITYRVDDISSEVAVERMWVEHSRGGL